MGNYTTYLPYIIAIIVGGQIFAAGVFYISETDNSYNSKLRVWLMTLVIMFIGGPVYLILVLYYSIIEKGYKWIDNRLLLTFQIKYIWLGMKHTTSLEVLDVIKKNRERLLKKEEPLTIREKRHITVTNWVEKNTRVVEFEN